MIDEAPAAARPRVRRPMVPRDIAEPGRTATPLELFFDLCFIVAVALASERLHHALTTGHVGWGLLSYAMVFFAIWWAWMNFTWFASAYDTDDVLYRVTVFVQIAGALIFAAGVPRAFDHRDFVVVTIGYAVMRGALVANWLRAATHPDSRAPALRFAIGVTLCEIGWLALLALPLEQRVWGWPVLVSAELAVPLWAEHARRTPWHPRHIAERYGLFTLIVLGESVFAATVAVQVAADAQHGTGWLYQVAAGGLLIVLSMWWLYFAKPAYRFLRSNREGFRWGYGHYFVFAAGGAVGAGLAVSVDEATGHTELSRVGVGATVTVPVAIFALAVWLLQHRPFHVGRTRSALGLVAAALVLAATFTPWPIAVAGLVLAGQVAVSTALR